jgi:hypothetical protein
MDHSLGESQNYHRPVEQELLEDYLKAIPLLTINEDNRLKIENEQLRGENKYGEYIIKGKLEEKDKQIEILRKKQEKTDLLIQSLIDSGQLRPSHVH